MTIDYTPTDFRKGQRIQMHPATDLFMRGARYGIVTHVGRKFVHVKLDLDPSGRVIWVAPRNLLPVF